jgi:hypothetical protein
MTAALAVLAAAAAVAAPPQLDPQQLPRLPTRGLALETRDGVQLETMRGRPLGILKGLDLAPDKARSSDLLMRDRRGRLFEIDLNEGRVRRVLELPQRIAGCRTTDARPGLQLLVCGHTVQTLRAGPGSNPERRVVAKAPGRVGHWVRAAFAPRGDAFLAQWSAGCEVPVAFLVAGGVMRPYGGRSMSDAPESVALGWLPDGSAVIHFPKGACGGTFHLPGVYAVSRAGTPRLLRPTPRFASVWMWGG